MKFHYFPNDIRCSYCRQRLLFMTPADYPSAIVHHVETGHCANDGKDFRVEAVDIEATLVEAVEVKSARRS